jgi:hypothetical protein
VATRLLNLYLFPVSGHTSLATFTRLLLEPFLAAWTSFKSFGKDSKVVMGPPKIGLAGLGRRFLYTPDAIHCII